MSKKTVYLNCIFMAMEVFLPFYFFFVRKISVVALWARSVDRCINLIDSPNGVCLGMECASHDIAALHFIIKRFS